MIEGMARNMDEAWIAAAGTTEWAQLAREITGLQRAADAVVPLKERKRLGV
jgi:hypothetical protein